MKLPNKYLYMWFYLQIKKNDLYFKLDDKSIFTKHNTSQITTYLQRKHN